MQEHKIIFHIDELDKWDLLLKDVSILVDALSAKKFNIEVLATSEAFKFYDLNENSYENINLMKDLNKKGVKFVVGKNHLMTHNINSNNLFHFVDTVPVESLELINKQSDGYIYLKAWEPFVNNTSYSA
ncbi:DsrE family protein [Clostridium sp.]|uniref:DsrE family protein n=1 Tax=Clostridium sp. TaxID=1506 RepID=UPI002586D896|nr:DsrE family protein [Clostridium sp.]MDF2505462.1 hypothetical protein [Clostridium sp.]